MPPGPCSRTVLLQRPASLNCKHDRDSNFDDIFNNVFADFHKSVELEFS